MNIERAILEHHQELERQLTGDYKQMEFKLLGGSVFPVLAPITFDELFGPKQVEQFNQ